MSDKPSRVAATSPDVIEPRLQALRDLFPEAFSEDKVDSTKLCEALGDFVDDGPERYSFSWAGKRDAIRLLQMPTRAALVPAPEESLDWDTTGNLFIEGENLETLKLLLRPYYGRVKMIYIDPPYNTGNDFIYPDDYRDPLGAYLEQTGQVAGQGDKTHRNRITSGRRHSAWLSMMYPRLWLARQLLRDDGVIFVSIDDNEVHNLRMLMGEVFGEENCVAQVVWQKVYSPRMDAQGFSDDHDYLLTYTRSGTSAVGRVAFEQNLSQFTGIDEATGRRYRPRSLRKEGKNSRREDRPNLFFPITAPDGSGVLPIRSDGSEGCWRWSRERYEGACSQGLIEWTQTAAGWQPYVKQFLAEHAVKPPSTIWLHSDVGHNHEAVEELKTLIGPATFPNPKPTRLLRRMMEIAVSPGEDAVVVDFFAGSCTTAQAVLELNREDGGNRRFIMVQMPEPTDQEEFPTIAEIGKERIRRVVARMKEDQQGKLDLSEREAPEDLGFRVFKLALSGYRNWAGVDSEDDDTLPDDYAQQMELFSDGLVDGWEPDAVVAETALKEAGFGLSYTVDALGDALYRISDPDAERFFYLSLADDVQLSDVEPLQLDTETLFVCRAIALDDTTAGNLQLQCRLKVI